MSGNKKIIITELNIENKRFLLSGLLEDDALAEVRLEVPGKTNDGEILGNIYVGRVQKIVKDLNAAFIEIAPGLACYYPLEKTQNPVFVKKINSPHLVQGDELLVQVQREAVKTKAPTVATNLNLTGRYAVLTTENRTIGVSGKFNKEEKVYYKNLLTKHLRMYLSISDINNCCGEMKETDISYAANNSRKNDVESEGYSEEDGENFGDDLNGRKTQEHVKALFPYGVIIRTNARNASDDEILAEIDSLKSKMDDMIAYAQTRTCFSCVYRSEPKYLLFLQNSYKEGLSEIVTDLPAIYEELSSYCNRYADLREIPLRFYEDSIYPLAKLYNLNRQMERAIQKKVWLKSGGFLVIEPTEALTVIDVNTGKSVSKKDVQKHFLEINLEASAEIARQLRLRNISGIIIIDYIDMESRDNQERLMSELRRLVKSDPIPVQVHDMTRLNLVEVTRKKVEKPLAEQFRS